MMKACSLFGVFLCLLLASSCGNKDAVATGGPQATVFLRDGTKFVGMVTSSSPSSVTLASEGNTTHTFDMKDVKTVEYGDPVTTPAPASNASAPSVVREPEAHVEHYHPQESVIRTKTNELRSGTNISVRTEETIDASKAVEGQGFAAEVSKDVLDAAGDVVIPRGSNAKIVIRSKTRGGKIKGSSDLFLDLESVAVDGRQYKLDTVDLQREGRDGVGKNKRTAEYVGIGAAAGTVIGAIFGQGKGAAIGAASGAGAGAATQVVTRGSIKIPVETLLTFQLDKALRVVASGR